MKCSESMKNENVLGSLSKKPIHVAVAVLLLFALLPLPYGFYQFLRVAVFSAAGFLAWQMFNSKHNGWMVVMIAMALLFNPIAPIYFSRELWMLLDLIAANLFIACPVENSDNACAAERIIGGSH